MARLALSVGLGIVGGLLAIATAGAATPAIFGLGFSIGSVVGGVAGSLLFPPGGSVGPRLNDLQVSSSAPGNPIPFGYGQFRLGGQIIWAQTLQEHKKNQSAKGGPTVTTYDYTCTFAVSFGFGPGTIVQLWGDSQCIYDTTGTQQVGTLADSNGNTVQLSVALYEGDEFQMPDPVVSSIQGADQTPGYRGQIYAVFDNLDLTSFGNRVPNLRALVNYGGLADGHPSHVFPDVDVTYPVIDQTNRVYYMFTPATLPIVSKFSLVDNSVIFQDLQTPWPTNTRMIFEEGLNGHLMAACDPQGFIWCITTANSVDYSLTQLNPNTMAIVSQSGLFVGTSGGVPAGSTPTALNMYSPGDGNTYVVCHCVNSNGDAFVKYRISDGNQNYSLFQLPGGESITFLSFDSSFISCDGFGNCFTVAHSGTYTKWYIWNGGGLPVMVGSGAAGAGPGVPEYLMCNPQNNTILALTDQGILYVIDAVGFTILATYGNTTTSNTWPGANDAVALNYLILDDNSNVQECSLAGTTGAYEPGHFPVGKPGQDWNPDIGGLTQDGSVRWTNLGPAPFAPPSGNFGFKACMVGMAGRVQNGILLLQVNSGSDLTRVVRASDLTTVATFDLFTDYLTTGHQALKDWAYDYVYGSVIFAAGISAVNNVCRAYIVRNGAAGTGLDVIVGDLATRAGLTSDQLDLTLIADTVCLGYVVTNPQGAAQCISPLCQAYLFDLIESDFVLKAVPRGQASSWTIPEDDLGLEEDKKKLLDTLTAYTDVPKDVTITYVDPNLDYQQGSQHRKRHSKTTKSVNQTIINLPFVMSPDDAMQLADKMTWLAELEREAFDFNTWKALYMLMDPTDVITFTYEGLTFIARVIKNSIGQNYAVEVSGVNQDANAYLSQISGVGQPGFIKGGVAAFGPTILFLLDTTLMQDADASPIGQTGTYFAFASPVVGNPGAVLYQSSDQQTYNSVDQASDHIAYGFSTNALGVPSSPWKWDMVNTITLFFADTDVVLTSTSALNVYNGANGALIGKELIQYQFATQNANGSWTLSGLLRGRRGTEWACGSHVNGEACFFPQVQGGIHRLVMNANLIGLIQYFKAITFGGDLNSGATQPLTLAGNDVKPYTPVDVQGTKDGSGNLTIQWQRRTRIGAGNSIAGTWPVSEATEAYDVVITDNLGVVKRTFSNVQPPFGGWSSPAFPHVAYTATQQTADFGGVQTTYYFQVYQRSALTFTDGTNRGFETKCVLALGLSATQRAVETFLYH